MRSPLVPIFLIVLVDVFALTLIIPLLPFYAEHFGATPEGVGLLGATFAACQLVAGPLLGGLSDRFGRKPVLVVSQLGTFVGFLVLSQAWALWVVFASRVIDGVTAGNLSVAQAYIADVTAPKDRARAFALIGVSFGVGFLFGPALSGVLASYNVRWPIYAAAGFSALSVLATLALLPSIPPRVEAAPEASPLRESASAPTPGAQGRRLGLLDWGSYAGYFRRPGLALRLWQFFLFTLAFSLFSNGFALFAERRFVTGAGRPYGPREVGYVLAFTGLIGVFLQGGLVGRLVARFGESKMVVFGFVVQAAGFSMLSGAGAVPSLLASAAVSSVGNAPIRASLSSLITRSVGPHEQGVVLGLTQSLNAVASIVAPPLAGVIIGRGWTSAWALTAAGISLLGGALSVASRGSGPGAA